MGAGGYKTLNEMKRVVIFMLLAIGFSEIAVAQKGMQSVGVNIPMYYRKNNFSTGIGINYQYNFSNYFRGEFVATYMPIHISKSITTDIYYDGRNAGTTTTKSAYVLGQALLNAHLFFSAPRHIRPYLIVGGGIQVYNMHQQDIISNDVNKSLYPYLEEVVDKKTHRGRWVVNIGIGLDCRLSYRWTMQLSAIALCGFLHGEIANRDAVRSMDIGASVRIGVNYNF